MSRSKQLRYLYESAKLGTMRAASEKLNVEPSTISRQIAEHEKALGIELIEKRRRKITLTEAGKLTIEYYREINAQKETYQANLENLKSAKSGKINLSTGNAIITDEFCSMLDRFITANPNLKLHIHTGGAREIINHVLTDESHFGIIFHITKEPKISIRLSLPQPLQAIVSPSHPFAQQEAVELVDIAKEPLALPSKSFQLRQIILEAESTKGYSSTAPWSPILFHY
jgi:DNA-binding transcriptional LysR family regulator